MTAKRAAKGRKRHDEASKLLFLREAIADMLTLLRPDIAGALLLDRIEAMPTEYVEADRTKRLGDAVFRVPFRRGRFPDRVGKDGVRRGRRRYLLMPTEFQSADDGGMLERMRDYTERMLSDYRTRGLVREGEDPPVLAIVVYTGPGRWRAKDGSEAVRALPRRLGRRLARYQPQAYIPVAVDELDSADWPADSRFASAARLVQRRSPGELYLQLAAEMERHPGAKRRKFRRGMHAWTDEMVGDAIELPPFVKMDGTGREEMKQLHRESVEAWGASFVAKGREEGLERGIEQGREEGIEQGREEGIAAGQRDLLVGMAANRFGADAVERLSGVLDGRPSRRLVADAATLIVSCANAREFAERLGELHRTQLPAA